MFVEKTVVLSNVAYQYIQLVRGMLDDSYY